MRCVDAIDPTARRYYAGDGAFGLLLFTFTDNPLWFLVLGVTVLVGLYLDNARRGRGER